MFNILVHQFYNLLVTKTFCFILEQIVSNIEVCGYVVPFMASLMFLMLSSKDPSVRYFLNFLFESDQPIISRPSIQGSIKVKDCIPILCISSAGSFLLFESQFFTSSFIGMIGGIWNWWTLAWNWNKIIENLIIFVDFLVRDLLIFYSDFLLELFEYFRVWFKLKQYLNLPNKSQSLIISSQELKVFLQMERSVVNLLELISKAQSKSELYRLHVVEGCMNLPPEDQWNMDFVSNIWFKDRKEHSISALVLLHQSNRSFLQRTLEYAAFHTSMAWDL